jgi:nucleoside 2-deoxyribosyltransferase
MKAFLSIKYRGDNRNRQDIEQIIAILERVGLKVFCFVRDAENWGEKRFEPPEMMKLTFAQIDESDILIADVADWPIGVGVEAGYAFARGIPVVCICPEDKKLADTVAGIAKYVFKYKSYDDLYLKLKLLVS